MHFNDLLNNPTLNQEFIHRYSSVRLVKPESVDAHVSECVGIALIFWSIDKKFDLETVLAGIAVHDIGECFTGDVIRPVKYFSKELKEEFQKAEDHFITKALCPELCTYIQNVKKHPTFEAMLLGFIDILQASLKLYLEMRIQRTEMSKIKFNESLGYLDDSYNTLINNDFGNHDTLLSSIEELVDSLFSAHTKETL